MTYNIFLHILEYEKLLSCYKNDHVLFLILFFFDPFMISANNR